jgi:ParB family chromosome partitioning protein
MANRSASKIHIESYDELLGVAISETGAAMEIDIKKLHPFKDHPFHVVDDEKMSELVESIKKNGVMVPGLARKTGANEYEIISGHRRKRACELAGLITMPFFVKEMNDDEAVVAMVDANIQREEILPSERAFALKMKVDAISHQGERSDLSSTPTVQRLSVDEVGEEFGISRETVRRYIRLTELTPELLDLVDKRRLGFRPAVDISYLKKKDQKTVYEFIIDDRVSITMDLAKKLRTLSEEGTLNVAMIQMVLVPPSKSDRTLKLNEESLVKYFDKSFSEEEIKKVVFGLLDDWASRRG